MHLRGDALREPRQNDKPDADADIPDAGLPAVPAPGQFAGAVDVILHGDIIAQMFGKGKELMSRGRAG